VDVEVQKSDWDDQIISSAVEQLDPQLQAQIELAGKEGRAVMLVQKGPGEAEIIRIDEAGADRFDPSKSIFSARVTAYKPA
jgi:hypothetical protein